MALRTSALVLVLLLCVSAVFAGNEGCGDSADFSAKAPETFEAKFATSQGDFVIEVNRAWAPLAADRFYNLVKSCYYDNVHFFPRRPGFAVQFGIQSDSPVLAGWNDQRIADDPTRESNKAGFVTFAKGAPHAPTTQVIIHLGDNSRLDSQGFAPFGKVTQGMDVIEKLNREYVPPTGSPVKYRKVGKLDYIRKASAVGERAD